MPAEIITVANHKGGVTKSTSTINLAVGLALTGRRVLCVDCDAQSNTTSVLGPRAGGKIDVEDDLYDVITGVVEARKAIVATRIEGLDLLPATLALSRLDQEMISMHRREEQIRRRLTPIMDDYDVIVLDLPPNLGQVVIAGLSAASLMILATDATEWGVEGVLSFVEWSAELRAAEVLTADLVGVLISKYVPEQIASREALDALVESGLPIFDTKVPLRTAANRMAKTGIVVGDKDADPDLATAYASAVVELLEKIQAVQERRGRHARA